MKFEKPMSLEDLNAIVSWSKIVGDESVMATGINEIHKVEQGDIAFVDFEKYYDVTLNSAASVIIIDKEVDCPEGKTLLVCEKPFEVYNSIVDHFSPKARLDFHIGENVDMGEGVHIEPGVIIGNNVVIGDRCHIQGNAYIGDHTHIGADVIIESGALIGTDAFYFKKEDGKYTKLSLIHI